MEGQLRAFHAQLDPRDLDVVYVAVQRYTSDGVDLDRLGEGGTSARLTLQEERRAHVDERQRHELGEAAGFSLDVAQHHQVSRPVERPVHMAEHDRGGRAQPHGVRRPHHIGPLPGVDLVGTDDLAYLVVQNLRRCARKSAEPGLFEIQQKLVHGDTQGVRALPYFERGEGVYVHLRHLILDGPQVVDVVLSSKAAVDAADHANLGRAFLPRLACAAGDLHRVEQVRVSAQVE